jgi:hypothetical protein
MLKLRTLLVVSLVFALFSLCAPVAVFYSETPDSNFRGPMGWLRLHLEQLPFIFLLIWLALLAVAIKKHGRRGLWLLVGLPVVVFWVAIMGAFALYNERIHEEAKAAFEQQKIACKSPNAPPECFVKAGITTGLPPTIRERQQQMEKLRLKWKKEYEEQLKRQGLALPSKAAQPHQPGTTSK